MRYALLICADEKWMAGLDDTEESAMPGRLRAVAGRDERHGASCKEVSVCGRRSDATTVRVRDGETLDVGRSVRRDQGAEWAGTSSGRLQGPGRGHRDRRQDPQCRPRDDRSEADLGDVEGAGGPTPAVQAAVSTAFRDEWGRIVATLIRMTGDWDAGRGVRPGRLRHGADRLAPAGRAPPARAPG